ncbi:hypothetical protein J6T21_02200 [Candidatus Saccharibacteria bacterium]|nr:hypothetical protein [Candidatus Saccharibacteria bacterium]
MKKTVSTLFALLLGFLPFFAFTPKASAYNNSNYYSFSGLTPMEEITVAEIDHDTSFFVSPDGNDETGDGTITKPYKTVNKAIAEASNPIWDTDCNTIGRTPNTIYLREGTYPENVVVDKNNITIRNYPGETARVTGGGLTTYNANIYIMKNLSNIRIYGLNIEDRHEEGIEGVYGILVRGGTSNIIIQNNTFKNIHANLANYDGTHGNNATGVIVYGDQETVAHNILIANNEFTDIECGFSEVITVNGYTAMVDVIENYIHDVQNIGIDIAGQYGANSDPAKDYARYVYVAGNRIDNAASASAVNAGIYVDGAKNVLVERNMVTNSPMGISIGEENQIVDLDYFTEGIIVSSNLLVNNTKSGLRIGTSSLRNSAVVNSVIVNNTIINPNTAAGAPIVVGKSHDNKIINNVIVDRGTWNGIFYTDDYSTTADFYNYTIDYNFFFAYNYNMWQFDGPVFNIAGQTFPYNDFNNSGYGEHNVFLATGTDVSLNSVLDINNNIVDGSALEGAGVNHDYDWLRDYEGNLRDTNSIDLGYLANNIRISTTEDMARLTTEFPFTRDVLSDLVYGPVVNPDDIVVPEGMVCPYLPEEPEPTEPEPVEPTEPTEPVESAEPEPTESESDEEELAVPDTGASALPFFGIALTPENFAVFGVIAGVSVVVAAGIYVKFRE